MADIPGHYVFHRIGPGNSQDVRYSYSDSVSSPSHTFMTSEGEHIYANIMNGSGEDLIFGNSLRAKPKLVPPSTASRFLHSHGEIVVTVWRRAGTVVTPNPNVKPIVKPIQQETVNIPYRRLVDGVVWIEGLGGYLTLAANINALISAIREDTIDPTWGPMSVSMSHYLRDPSEVYADGRIKVDRAVVNSDSFWITSSEPERLGTVRLCIMDVPINPSLSNRVYGSLSVPPGMVEIHYGSRGSEETALVSIDALMRDRVVHFDTRLYDTMSGPFFGGVITWDRDALVDYIHDRKARFKFTREKAALAEMTADFAMSEKIKETNQIIADRDVTIADLTEQLEEMRSINTKLEKRLKLQREQVKAITDGDALGIVAETITTKLETERLQALNDRQEQINKESKSKIENSAVKVKFGFELIKSSIGLIVAAIGLATAVLAFTAKKKGGK
jgi:hypothetical protein